jgi:hypothetical protein
MITKLALILAVVALVASAGTVPGVGHYTVTLSQPSVIQGTLLKAGEYRLVLAASKVTIINESGKSLVEAPVTVETQDKKFDSTAVGFDTATGQNVIFEIRLGGTKTKLKFN